MKARWMPAVVLLVLLQTYAADAQYRRSRYGMLPPYRYGYGYGVIIPQQGIYPTWPDYYAASTQTFYGPAPVPHPDRATIRILLPSSANDIWVDGVKVPTRETTERVFVSPPLEPGHYYSYHVRAAWPGPEGMITREETVAVGPNQVATVDFTQRPR